MCLVQDNNSNHKIEPIMIGIKKIMVMAVMFF